MSHNVDFATSRWGDEQQVGIWIDGTPLYRKVITTTKTGLVSGENTFDTGLSNISIVSAEWSFTVATIAGTNYICPFISAATSSNDIGLLFRNGGSQGVLLRRTDSPTGDSLNRTFIFVLYYTKD